MKITHKSIEDERGILYPISLSEIPFDVKRVFFVTDVPKEKARGQHRHKECQQYFLCLKGKIEVTDPCRSFHKLLNPGQGILVKAGEWTEERYLTGKDLLMVFCSHEYDPNDYEK